MSARFPHNGCDTLMLGFDYELRKRGYAGNSCQIVLELSAEIEPRLLEQRLSKLAQKHPILCSRPARGFNFKPYWKPVRRSPVVRVHTDSPGLLEKLFNEPLDVPRGQLIRFDVIGRTVVFTWAHALMDAKSAEYFLALVGDEKVPEPEAGEDWFAKRALTGTGLRARASHAWRELRRLDVFRSALPVSIATHRKSAKQLMKFKVETFSNEESARVRANAGKLCGFLGDTNYHLAAGLYELHQLHQRTGCNSPSYVMPMAVGLRPKGTRGPLFSNQITMMVHQFMPSKLATLEQTAAAVKATNVEYLREEHTNPGIILAQMFRCLPLPLYIAMVKHGMGGEICSLFFGDTASVDSALRNFFGATIEKFAHVPAVTVPPGVGVVFYRFNNRLQFTLVHAEGVLTDIEAEEFAAALRGRLLDA